MIWIKVSSILVVINYWLPFAFSSITYPDDAILPRRDLEFQQRCWGLQYHSAVVNDHCVVFMENKVGNCLLLNLFGRKGKLLNHGGHGMTKNEEVQEYIGQFGLKPNVKYATATTAILVGGEEQSAGRACEFHNKADQKAMRCPDNTWAIYGKSCFKAFSHELSQKNAEESCATYHGHLAEIFSDGDNKFVASLAAKQLPNNPTPLGIIWTSIHYSNDQSKWELTSSIAARGDYQMEYTRWRPNIEGLENDTRNITGNSGGVLYTNVEYEDNKQVIFGYWGLRQASKKINYVCEYPLLADKY